MSTYLCSIKLVVGFLLLSPITALPPEKCDGLSALWAPGSEVFRNSSARPQVQEWVGVMEPRSRVFRRHSPVTPGSTSSPSLPFPPPPTSFCLVCLSVCLLSARTVSPCHSLANSGCCGQQGPGSCFPLYLRECNSVQWSHRR